MKYVLPILSIVLLIAFSASADSPPSDVARIHVIANSDSREDVRLKMKVADEVKELLKDGICHSREDIETLLESRLDEITRRCNAVLREEGSSQLARAEVGVRHFERRTIDSSALPEGDYLSLVITLGEGEGHNWWGLLFPDVCFEASLALGEEESAGKTVVLGDMSIIRIRCLLAEMLQKCNNLMLTN